MSTVILIGGGSCGSAYEQFLLYCQPVSFSFFDIPGTVYIRFWRGEWGVRGLCICMFEERRITPSLGGGEWVVES
jgi:hypothetical protein